MTSVWAPPRRRVYRTIATLWAAIGGAVAAGVFLVIGVTHERGRVGVLVVAGITLLAAGRMWTTGIRVQADGVTVGAFVISRRVSWSEIDHFAVMPLGRYPYVGYVVLRDGRKFGTFGLATSADETEGNRLRVQRPIDELNSILADWRQAEAREGPTNR
jgi:hypothetical protein